MSHLHRQYRAIVLNVATMQFINCFVTQTNYECHHGFSFCEIL